MKKNMGLIDKVVRIIIALVIAIAFFTDAIPSPYNIILLVLAIVFVLTSLIGFCPLYIPFRLTTLKKSK